MEYQNIDEETRRQACERVKQIVKAIKSLRIKYYINFSKISDKDRETYQKLETNLDKVSVKYNLNDLKVALMEEEVDRYYGNKNDDSEHKDNNINNGKYSRQQNILNRTYGAVDAEQEALRKGKIRSAKICKQMWKQYVEELEEQSYKQMALNYKRAKFEELVQLRSDIEEKAKKTMKDIQSLHKSEYTQEMSIVDEMFKREIQKNKIEMKQEVEKETIRQ